MHKTFVAKPKEITRKWWIIDAKDVVLGRLSTTVANILRGKDKVIFTKNVDCGDHVVIINAKDIKLTGKKLSDKKYFWHTGYPGGIKEKTAGKILAGDHPERIIRSAVSRMISRGPLQRDVMAKLKIYSGAEHPHEAQQPEIFDIASKNKKNKR